MNKEKPSQKIIHTYMDKQGMKWNIIKTLPVSGVLGKMFVQAITDQGRIMTVYKDDLRDPPA